MSKHIDPTNSAQILEAMSTIQKQIEKVRGSSMQNSKTAGAAGGRKIAFDFAAEKNPTSDVDISDEKGGYKPKAIPEQRQIKILSSPKAQSASRK
jgi:glycerate kinase